MKCDTKMELGFLLTNTRGSSCSDSYESTKRPPRLTCKGLALAQGLSVTTFIFILSLHSHPAPTFHHTDPEKPPTPPANHKDRRWCMKCAMFPSSAQVALNVRLWSLFITSKCRRDVSITRPDVQISRVVSALTVPCLPRPSVYLRRGALATGGSPS